MVHADDGAAESLARFRTLNDDKPGLGIAAIASIVVAIFFAFVAIGLVVLRVRMSRQDGPGRNYTPRATSGMGPPISNIAFNKGRNTNAQCPG